MKFKFIYTLFIFFLCSVFFMASKDGRAFSQGAGNTGAPGDETNSNGSPKTCQSCHATSSAIQVLLDIEVRDNSGNPVSEYMPGQTYEVQVTLHSLGQATPAGYGFQMLCLKAPHGQPGENWQSFSNPAENVRIAIASSNGRQYAEHKGPSATNEFVVEWTAPAAGTGTITFYACGNGVNLNNNSGGDNAACNFMELDEGGILSVEILEEPISMSIFPNPVGDFLHIKIDSGESGVYDWRIFNLEGRLVKSGRFELSNSEKRKSMDVGDLASGYYFFRLGNGENVASRKLVKW